jgi:hypothetical protein
MSKLVQGFECARAHIDDLLVLTAATFNNHLEKLDEVPRQLTETELKGNANKLFLLNEEGWMSKSLDHLQLTLESTAIPKESASCIEHSTA